MKNLLKKMTLKQKAGQLNQYLYGWECYQKINNRIELSEKIKAHILEFDGIGAIYGLFRADPWSGVDYNTGLTYPQAIELLNKIRKYILDNCSLPIMPLIIEEMPHGHQGLNAKCYPVNIAVGASFNPRLYAQAMSEQLEYANYHGINVGLISGLDVARDCRWGRTEETFGSDPYLSSKFTSQVASRFKNEKTVGCLKHFVAQGAPYMGLNSGAVNIGERELREIHLPPTKAATKNGIDFIMAAYNEIDGIPCHVNKWLLNDVLKGELGFKGIVMADGQALNRLKSQNISTNEAANLAITAGIGLSLWDDVYLTIDEAVQNNIINEKLVDEKVLEILELKNKLNLIGYSTIKETELIQSDELNYELASESIILQKNQFKYFPINKEENCLFIGDTFDSIYTFLGDYTAYQNTEKYLNLKQLIITQIKFADCMSNKQALRLSIEELNDYDKVIVIGGGTSARDFGIEFESNGAVKFGNGITDSGENIDVGTIELNPVQYQVCEKLTMNGVRFGFLCIQGRPYALKEIALNAEAIISAYYNGQLGPQAILDTLIGINNPSGKNPISMPFYPEYYGYEYNSKQDMRNQKYTQINDQKFEFGHGLTYSEIKYNSIKIHGDILTVEIENFSDLDTREVVQIYIKKENSIIVKRQRELVEFKKILIPAYNKVEVPFKIKRKWFESLDINMDSVIEKGSYEIIVGTGIETRSKFVYKII